MLEIFSNTFLLLGVLVFVCLYFYFHVTYSYWKKRGVPTTSTIPPFGNFAEVFLFKTNSLVCLNWLYNKFEGQRLAGLYRFSTPALMLRDPELIKEVTVKGFKHFHSRGLVVDLKLNPLLENLFLLTGSKWRNLRTKLTPTFTSEKMKMMFPMVASTGEELINYLQEPAEKEVELEIFDILARFTTDIIASCAFGVQCNCLKYPNAEFRVWGRKLFSPSLKTFLRSLTLSFPALNRYLGIAVVPIDVNKYFTEMVRETVEYREKNNVQRKDFLQLLIQLKNKTLGAVEDEEMFKVSGGDFHELHASAPFDVTMEVMAAQAFVFYLGGFETSSTTISFCLYELALNTNIQDKVRREIDQIFEKHNGKLTYDFLMQLEYLDKVVNETLRKHPPLPLLTRECANTIKLGGTDLIVEKGTPIMLPVYGLHHDPQYFPEPEIFDPERFNEEEKQKRPYYCYLPFGEGPRICIGKRFGLMQTKVGLISVLSNYEVHVSEKTPMPLKYDPKSLLIAPKGGMWLKITKRIER